MSFIHSLEVGVPDYHLSQLEIYEYAVPILNPRYHSIFKKILQGSKIRKRHFSTSVEEFVSMTQNKRIADKFALWKETSMAFYTKQISLLLEQSGLEPGEIDGICTATTSGFITPDPTILLAQSFGMRPNIKRIPLFGFGCSGGMAAITSVHEYLTLYPKKAVIICVGETLSTQYEKAESVSVLVSNSIFGDGFGSMLMVGKEHKLADSSQVEISDPKSYVFPNCNFAIGQWMSDEGIHTHLDARLPNLIKSSIKEPMQQLFNESETEISDVKYWSCHAGGPKVMEAFSEALELRPDALDVTLETYYNYGNQSSVSVLMALQNTLKIAEEPGLGFLMGMGPGIHMEYALCSVTPQKRNSSNDEDHQNTSKNHQKELVSVEEL